MYGITVAAALAAGFVMAAPARAVDLDAYACFGGGRYVAMAASFTCADLPAFCAVARGLLVEAGGNEREAEKLARDRGYGRTAVALAHRFCKVRDGS
jgi:hypothetical protein